MEKHITQLKNHRSICVRVTFNESQGQFKTNEIIRLNKQLDSTRLFDGLGGCT